MARNPALGGGPVWGPWCANSGSGYARYRKRHGDGVLVAVLGLVGLFLAAGALDDEISIFGFGLAGFAVVFDLGLIRAHFDRRDAAKVTSP